MKHILYLFTFALISSASLNAQNQNNYLSSELIDGCPSNIEFIKSQLNLTDMTESYLSTGNEELDVMVGQFNQHGRDGYWISLFNKEKLLAFMTIGLSEKDDLGFPSETLHLNFDNSSKKITIRLRHNIETNAIEYYWLNNNQISDTIAVENVDKLIQKNKIFPAIEVKTLEGEVVSMEDFKDKYVVINWWATTCGPCIQEMPRLNTLVEKYKSNPNIVFLAIAFDDLKRVENFLNRKEFHYIQTVGDKETAKLFGESFPRNLIVNPEGVVTFYQEGGNPMMYKEIDKELEIQINL